MTECTIERIFLYPVKGCRAVEVQDVELTFTGITGDRGYVILYEGGFANLKSLPALSMLAVALKGDGLVFSASGHEDLVHTRQLVGDQKSLRFYADEIRVLDQGDAVASWLTGVIGVDVRLATLKENFDRKLPVDILEAAHGVEQDGFCDLSPILLVNAATLDDVNRQLSDDIPVERFRCNIVVRGLEPYAEDAIQSYQGQGLSLTHVVACERCVIINTDHRTGIMNKEPLKLLHGNRRIEGGYSSGVRFGNYFNVAGGGKLSVGNRLAAVY
ncbi:MAG: MOSC N-terminal beta barrel domain-containing protein [Chloroflexota bacterium]|nr:MOSC N-terminal beta barrel domain-containing protein [Chloroflexota bacterium]